MKNEALELRCDEESNDCMNVYDAENGMLEFETVNYIDGATYIVLNTESLVKLRNLINKKLGFNKRKLKSDRLPK